MNGCVINGIVVCYDEQGQRMESYVAEAKARKNAEARAAELEARLRQLEEELRRYQGDQPQ